MRETESEKKRSDEQIRVDVFLSRVHSQRLAFHSGLLKIDNMDIVFHTMTLHIRVSGLIFPEYTIHSGRRNK